MNETNKSLRIRTNVGTDKYVSVNLTSEYDTLEILSLKINQRGAYRYHTNTYGVVVGRVMANNGFGVPNAKLSLFIEKDDEADTVESAIYPYTTVSSKNLEGVRYNLLPSNQKDDCHQVVGTFPSKRMVLDDNSIIEVFDKYYTYTTRTNESGDYMFFGVPVGTYNLHMDLDLSDCGKLSQRPRDFVYKGYNLDEFENPNQFKESTELSSLPQIFSQDTTVNVKPFWGDEKEGTEIGITREDINVRYTFEPTCVFIGSIVSDTPNDGINKRCVPSNKMGDMRELVTGSGTIEIIRKTVNHTIEELQIKGKQLINNDGVWCFQIPMNLDYVTTDEYGNTVPTDNPDKGIPTRCEVRFRMSMDETQSESLMYKRGKVLVPNNPKNEETIDYEFGSKTRNESFKSLMWNGVYSVKSFIPRFQKSSNITTNKFTGIKNVNIHGNKNPIPYNNIRIKIPFMFWLMCNVIKLFIRIIKIINSLKVGIMNIGLGLINLPYAYIGNEVCPDLEYWYFAPGMNTNAPSNTWVRKFWKWLTGKDNKCTKWEHESTCLTFKEIANTLKDSGEYGDDNKMSIIYQYIGYDNVKLPHVVSASEIGDIVGQSYVTHIKSMSTITNETEFYDSNDEEKNYKDYRNWYSSGTMPAPSDKMSTEVRNAITSNDPYIHLTPDIDYLMQCVEMNLAQEYEVIKFDFYNDWLNGVIYLPRWARQVKYKRKRKNGEKIVITKVKGCIDDKKRSRTARKYMQQCSLNYDTSLKILSDEGCSYLGTLKCHKKQGSDFISVLSNGGAVHEHETILGDNVYYMKPIDGKALMFATDIIMLGSLFDCNEYGIPSTFDSLVSTTYKMPTNLAMTNVDEDSYSYLDKTSSSVPRVSDIADWGCGSTCVLQYIAESGVTATIPSYDDLLQIMKDRGELAADATGKDNIVIEYDDIFPVTEMSGIEWGYRGPEFENSEDDYSIKDSSDKLFSPGGHFMGLACGNAETNIKSCVNLKRACEIGTTLSERLEIPIGFKDNAYGFDEVNYLYVTPNGLIAKDQIVDVTFRSVFATLNQNSLETYVDPVTNHKKYNFTYLVPDSFDGSIEGRVNNSKYSYNRRVPLEWDSYWDNLASDELPSDMNGIYENNIAYEQGYTITRLYDTKSLDYIAFRHGSNDLEPANFLKRTNNGYSMPIYRNSFYFYFGLKEGATALDEFRKQFFASCAKTSIIGKQVYVDAASTWAGTGFTYNMVISTYNMKLPLTYTIDMEGDNYPSEKVENYNNDVIYLYGNVIGDYNLTITDADGEVFSDIIEINDFSVNYDITSVTHYIEEEKREDISDFNSNGSNGGFIYGVFSVETPSNITKDLSYEVHIIRKKDDNIMATVVVGDTNWERLYDKDKRILWLFGDGTYEVWVVEYQNNVKTGGEYCHSIFKVESGIELPKIRIGAYDYYNEDGTSDFANFTLDKAKDDAWTDYEKYRTIVNVDAVPNEFYLNFNCGNDKKFKGIYAARPELKSGGVSPNIAISTESPNIDTVLDFSMIKYPSDYPTQTSDILRGDFYYTALNNYVFATPSQTFPVTNGKADIELPEMGVYCVVDGSNKNLYVADSGTKLHFVKDTSADRVICGKMLPCPVYYNPLSFTCVLTCPNGVINPNFLQFDVQSYKGRVFIDNNVDENGNIIVKNKISFTDWKDSPSRKIVDFEMPEFGSMRLKYAHYMDGKYEFKIANLNQNLNAVYYLCTISSEPLAFDCDGNFRDDYNSDTYEPTDFLPRAVLSMSIRNEGGDMEAFVFKEITDETIEEYKKVWSFGDVFRSYNSPSPSELYSKESQSCQIIRPTNVLEFDNNRWDINFKVSTLYFIHHLYKRNIDGKLVPVDVDDPLQIFENKQLLLDTDGSGMHITLLPNENNYYRYGVMYQHETEYYNGIIPEELNLPGYSGYVTKQEMAEDRGIYGLAIGSRGDLKMGYTLKEGVNLEELGIKMDNFKIVLVGMASDGEMIFEASPDMTFDLTFWNFKVIDHFEFLCVYDDKNEM